MLQLNYYIHLILNSKYRLLFTFLTYILIYFFVQNTHISYCMTEGTDIPDIAEAKPISPPKVELTNLEQLIHRNIDSYIEDKATIEFQRKEIDLLKNELNSLRERYAFILSDDHIGDEIANRGLRAHINEICKTYNQPLDYPWIDEYGNLRENY